MGRERDLKEIGRRRRSLASFSLSPFVSWCTRVCAAARARGCERSVDRNDGACRRRRFTRRQETSVGTRLQRHCCSRASPDLRSLLRRRGQAPHHQPTPSACVSVRQGARGWEGVRVRGVADGRRRRLDRVPAKGRRDGMHRACESG